MERGLHLNESISDNEMETTAPPRPLKVHPPPPEFQNIPNPSFPATRKKRKKGNKKQ
jgi:hypothetical protein